MSPRQIQIYYELVSGKSYKEISEELCISTETVKTHCRAVYQYFDVPNQKRLMGLILQLHIQEHPEFIKKLSDESEIIDG